MAREDPLKDRVEEGLAQCPISEDTESQQRDERGKFRKKAEWGGGEVSARARATPPRAQRLLECPHTPWAPPGQRTVNDAGKWVLGRGRGQVTRGCLGPVGALAYEPLGAALSGWQSSQMVLCALTPGQRLPCVCRGPGPALSGEGGSGRNPADRLTDEQRPN